MGAGVAISGAVVLSYVAQDVTILALRPRAGAAEEEGQEEAEERVEHGMKNKR